MSKVTLSNLTNLSNQTTAVTTINANNDALEAFSDTVLSRTGASPNSMATHLDMNSNRVINLPSAVSNSEPVTYSQFLDGLAGVGAITLPTTDVPVSAVMQPVVNAGTISAAAALLGISVAMQPVVGAAT